MHVNLFPILIILAIAIGSVIIIFISYRHWVNETEYKEQAILKWNGGICTVCGEKLNSLYNNYGIYYYECKNGHLLELDSGEMMIADPDNDSPYFTQEDIDWNNGICKKCNTKWHFKGTSVNGYLWIESDYIYECENGHTIKLDSMPQD